MRRARSRLARPAGAAAAVLARAPSARAPSARAPTARAPSPRAPSPRAPSPRAPAARAPLARAPTAEAPTARAPTAEAPTARAPTAGGLVGALIACALLTGCGGGSSAGSVSAPTVAPARVFTLAAFQPSRPVLPGRQTTVSFTVRLPNGKALTQYKTGAGPHTGVHLIIVRDDLRYIIHEHPPITPDGRLSQAITFPAPGKYRVLVDVYPNVPGLGPNFQLYKTVDVRGAYHPQALPAFRPDQTIDGYHIDIQGHPTLHAIQAGFVHVDVVDDRGHKVSFVPWFGALAHAIFFHEGSLDYFHTHVCGAGATNCTSAIGATRVTGTATAPGKLTLGVLLPVPGTWRLFLQMKLGGKVLTAPYTLNVAS